MQLRSLLPSKLHQLQQVFSYPWPWPKLRNQNDSWLPCTHKGTQNIESTLFQLIIFWWMHVHLHGHMYMLTQQSQIGTESSHGKATPIKSLVSNISNIMARKHRRNIAFEQKNIEKNTVESSNNNKKIHKFNKNSKTYVWNYAKNKNNSKK